MQCFRFRFVHELELLNPVLHSKVCSVRCVDFGSMKVSSTSSHVLDIRWVIKLLP